jgi:putative AlgH/UPF0301 family transcriptional regulator
MRRIAMIVLLGLASLSPARAQDLDRPMLLVADPRVSGPYQGTVVLALPTANGLHLGLTLNRPTALRASAMFPGLAMGAGLAAPLFLGGPDQSGSLFALVRYPYPPTEDAVEVLPGLYLVQGRDDVAQVASRVPARARFFVGAVVWQRGALGSELDAGAWLVSEPDTELGTNGSVDTLWQRMLERVRTMLAAR